MFKPLDRFVLAFRRDVARALPRPLDDYVHLYWEDRPAFHRAHEAAWASGRPEPFISLSRVRELNDDLSPKMARRLVRRLFADGRFRQASEVLCDGRYSLGQEASGLLDLARAELGLGELERAAAALARACELDAGVVQEASEIGETLARVSAGEGAAALSGRWGETRALFDLWLELGSAKAALRAISTAALRGVVLTDEELPSLHEALDTAVSLEPPISGYDLFRTVALLSSNPTWHRDMQTASEWLHASSAGGASRPLDGEVSPLVAGSAALALGQSGRTAPAIETLGALTLAHHKASYLRPYLARLVGREVLASHPLSYGSSGPQKIFDVFLFNNELRMLMLKLHEMADWVDHFVLVEARQTFTGTPKPLVFDQNKDQFAPFASKIIHVVVDAFPPHYRHPWAREFYQRNMGVSGLTGRVSEDDLVIISDSDEVVARDSVLGFEGEYAAIGMQRMRYFLNYRQALPRQSLKEYASVWRARYLRTLGLSYARALARADKRGRRIVDGGWHFTSVADATGIVEKLNNSSHQEHAGASTDTMARKLAALRGGEFEPGWERWEVDERFPTYIREHQKEFEDLLL